MLSDSLMGSVQTCSAIALGHTEFEFTNLSPFCDEEKIKQTLFSIQITKYMVQ